MTVKLVYIAGAGRSGSTLLNRILGAHPGICALGELSELPIQGWLENRLCACGERADTCALWSQVAATVVPDREALVPFARRYADEAAALSRMRRVLLGLDARAEPFPSFQRSTLALVDAIREASGSSVLVDASKSPGRALALSYLGERVDLRLVHLVRDARGVIFSFKKTFAEDERAGVQRDFRATSASTVAALWSAINLVTERVYARANRFVRLRYEDLVANPSEALARVGECIEEDLTGVAAAVTEGRPLPPEHAIAGNRMRMQRDVRLRPDLAWRDGLAARERLAFWLLAAPVARRYGYV